MSDLTKYGISLEVKAAMAALSKFKKASQTFNKQQVNALQTQIRLQQQLNKLKSGVQRKVTSTTSTTPKPSTPKPEMVGPQLNSLQRKAVNNQVKQAKQLAAQEERRLKALNKARVQVKSTTFMLKRGADAVTKEAQSAIKLSIASAKTADEVREAFRFHKNNTAQLRQQNFMMSRMKQSSEQIAGNMVSAFAIAAGGAAVTRIGQDFEAVNNTMLAVSENSEQAGENFQFVRQEAFRLGLGLKESAKGFAKMVSARGDMTLEDTKEAFKGVAEMSTLLGLSSEESGRAINALMQMMSKGNVTAEELKLQMGITLLI